MGTLSFLGLKRAGRGIDYPSQLAPRLKKSRGVHLLPMCTCLHTLFQGKLYLYRFYYLARRYVFRIQYVTIQGKIFLI
jgi:hypothetical protein